MWSELAAMINSYCRGHESNGTRGRALMALYGALANCQIAFERLEEHVGSAKQQEHDAAVAMEILLATLHNVQPTLQLLDLRRARELGQSIREGLPQAANTKETLRQRIELLRRLVSPDETRGDADDTRLADFSGARRRIASSISSAYSPTQLFTP